MKRLLLLLVPILACLHGQAQTPPNYPGNPEASADTNNRVKILNSDILSFRRENGVDIQRLIGNVRLLQDSTYFFCDSAYYFEQDNRFEAFGKVRAEMPDSVVMTADRATYDGTTRVAEAFGRILLRDRTVRLTTTHLTFNRELSEGYYYKGGKLVDGDTELTSTFGYYYPRQDMAYFKRQVVLVSPDYRLETDTLAYDTQFKVAKFVTQTLIKSKDGDIETTSGNYDTESKRVNLFARSQVNDSSYILTADTLFYDDGMSLGYAVGKVVVEQRDSTLKIRGNYGEFNRETDESLVSDYPVAVQVFDDDTLFLFADTLRSLSIQRIDTVMLVSDSLQQADPGAYRLDTLERRIFRGYSSVRVYLREMQAACDSLVYFYDDSVLVLHQSPMLWADETEIFGDTIKVWMKGGQADSMWIGPNAFLVSREDTVGFNQIKGKEMRASFTEGELTRLEVLGNSESVYWAKEEDSTGASYQGMNQALAQNMTIFFEENEVQRIVFRSKPEGSFKPMFEVLFQENRLDGMKWVPEARPVRPDVVAIMEGAWPPDRSEWPATKKQEEKNPEEETIELPSNAQGIEAMGDEPLPEAVSPP